MREQMAGEEMTDEISTEVELELQVERIFEDGD